MALQTLYGIEFGRRPWKDAVTDMHNRALEPISEDEDQRIAARDDERQVGDLLELSEQGGERWTSARVGRAMG